MAVGETAAAAEEVKLSISGAALAALLHRCAAATGDCDGLLFGRAFRPPAPAPTFSDYDDHAPAAPPLSISVSGHSSLSQPSSLSDPLGRFHPPSPSSPPPLGFFSSRRRAPLRPSMRELSLASSLSKTLQPLAHPLLVILVCPSASRDLSTHSFDYRAFLLRGSRLVPASLTVVNVGPGFRDQYHSFAPESPFPLLPTQPPPAAQGGDGHSIGEQKGVDAMVDGFGLGRLQGLIGAAAGQAAEMDGMYAGMLRRLEKLAREMEKSNQRVLDQPQAGDGHSIREQKAVDAMVEGFGLGRLQGLIGAAAGQAAEMDGMYAGMLRRLEKLAREVEKSNQRVLDQEKRNLLLRHRSAGLE